MLEIAIALLGFLKNKWKVIAVIALLAGVFYLGDGHGADRVQAEWTADQLEKAKQLAQAKADAAEKARQASQAHQDDLVKMRQTITQYERLVQYEIKRSYSGCVFTPELVRLWQQTFGGSDAGAGQP